MKELEGYAGIVTGASSGIGLAIANSLAEAGAGNVVIKCGRKGCYLKSGQESEWVPALSGIRCVDTTGAGDSFAAGFVYALSEGKSLRECAEFANRCGARAVGSVGAVEWTEQIY